MKDFKSMSVEVWQNLPSNPKNPPEDMLAIHAQMPDSSEGLRYIWFVLSRSEFVSLLDGRSNTAEDGYHKVLVHGDSWYFMDVEIDHRKKSGKLAAPFYSAIMPRTFMKAVLRLCKKTWALLAKGRKEAEMNGTSQHDLPHRIKIEISQEHRDNSSRLYGQGLGNVRLDFGDYKPEETMTFWNQCVVSGGETFRRCVEGIHAIARNSTCGFHQTATLRISKDWDGFNWTAISPRGRPIVNGGIVNHSRDSNGHDWSTHT